MFKVNPNAYIPIPKRIMIGTLAIRVVGSKNQKKPTLIVNVVGKIKVSNVAFFPKPSHKDQTNNTAVKNPSEAIEKNLNCIGKNCMPTNPEERMMEVTTNLFLLLSFNTFYINF